VSPGLVLLEWRRSGCTSEATSISSRKQSRPIAPARECSAALRRVEGSPLAHLFKRRSAINAVAPVNVRRVIVLSGKFGRESMMG
jgi:hypothetical protein